MEPWSKKSMQPLGVQNALGVPVKPVSALSRCYGVHLLDYASQALVQADILDQPCQRQNQAGAIDGHIQI